MPSAAAPTTPTTSPKTAPTTNLATHAPGNDDHEEQHQPQENEKDVYLLIGHLLLQRAASGHVEKCVTAVRWPSKTSNGVSFCAAVMPHQIGAWQERQRSMRAF